MKRCANGDHTWTWLVTLPSFPSNELFWCTNCGTRRWKEYGVFLTPKEPTFLKDVREMIEEEKENDRESEGNQ